ncbi:MAG: hypothetical protein K0S35_2455 [Geminicoccaceae bacterium]|jgi:hypothetical protein|nr:hypothetical protein [Geminicoccaceae bacterium]
MLLAKSLQGDKRYLYAALWLSNIRYYSCFCPVKRKNASILSRKSYAPSNSPTDPPRAGVHHHGKKVQGRPPALIFAAVSEFLFDSMRCG